MRRTLIAIATFAVVFLSLPAKAQICAPFTDVSASDPFCANIQWMFNRGVTFGCTANEYCPANPVRRDQMAAFLNRLADNLFPLTCAPGQVMKWSGLAWACANDALGGSGGGGTVTSVAAGTGLQGVPNPITGAGVLSIASGYQLPQACAANQVPKWNGSAWTCAADVGGSATLTSLGAGPGITLTPNPIVATGTVAADTAYLQRRVGASCVAGSSIRAIAADGTVTCETDDTGAANAFVQGGNAFGAAALIGTTDNQPLDVRVNNARVMRFEPAQDSPNVIGGHPANFVSAGVSGGTIGGGGNIIFNSPPNRVTDAYGTVSGGRANLAGDNAGTISDAVAATVGGGSFNAALGSHSVVAGGLINIASGSQSTVGGGNENGAAGDFSTVGGGEDNTSSGQHSSVGGGESNSASNFSSRVGGGRLNVASGDGSTVSGGVQNLASGESSTIGGGVVNDSTSTQSTIAGGSGNIASGRAATVGGGSGNAATGDHSTVPGGNSNTAAGAHSVALGRRAKALYDGNFVFADSRNFDFAPNVPNNFRVRATGGVRFVVGINPSTGANTWSCGLVDGDAGWNCSSDVNQKQDLERLDGKAVLDKLAAMPVYAWSPKGVNSHVRHYGPTAQDFHATFGLGDTDLGIGQQDADGVALAAIQGLNTKLEARLAERDGEMALMRAELAELRSVRAELAAIRAMMADRTAIAAKQLPASD